MEEGATGAGNGPALWKKSVLGQMHRNTTKYKFLTNIFAAQEKLNAQVHKYKEECANLRLLNPLSLDYDQYRERAGTVRRNSGNSSVGNDDQRRMRAKLSELERRNTEVEGKFKELESKHADAKESLLRMYRERDEQNRSERTANLEARKAKEALEAAQQELDEAEQEIERLNGEIATLKDKIEHQTMELNTLQTEFTAINLEFIKSEEGRIAAEAERDDLLNRILETKAQMAEMQNELIRAENKRKTEQMRKDLAEATQDLPDISDVVVSSKSYRSFIPSKAVHKIDAHVGGVSSGSFCSGGGKFATGGCDYAIKIWNQSGHNIDVLKGHTGTVTKVEFAFSKDLLLSASNDHSVTLWNLRTNRPKFCFTSHTDKVYSARFLSSSKIVSASQDRSVVIWNANRGSSERTFLQTSTCYDIINVDGTRFITSHFDKCLREWDLRQKGSKPARTHRTEHTQVISHIIPTPDRQSLLTCSRDGTLERVDMITFETEDIFASDELSIGQQGCQPSFSSNGYFFAVGLASGGVQIWDLMKKEVVKTLSSNAHDGPVTSVSWQGDQVVSTGLDGRVIIWEDED